MSVEYLISSLDKEKPDFDIELEYVKAELFKQWPHAEIHNGNGESSPGFTWRLYMDDYLVAGEFWANRNTLVIISSIIYAAKFAIWYRQLIPSQYTLFIVDYLGNHPLLEITMETIEEQVMANFK